jgi:hypothetical protein
MAVDFQQAHCAVCARPVAMARASCIYCGAPISAEVQEAAALAAQRVLQSKSLTHLETAAKGALGKHPPRRYLVIDTATALPETLAQACSISAWEARQWQAASRYRLLKVGAESPDGTLEAGLKESGLTFFSVPEQTVAPGRNPVVLESIDLSATPLQCTLRHDAEAPPKRRALPEQDVTLVISAFIKRERVRDLASLRAPADARMEDALLVHLHLVNEARPWEIDPHRTGYEGAHLASAHLSTRELVRRLSAKAPHDDAFRNIVPALAPGADPLSDFAGLKKTAKGASKELKIVVLDNVAQFREYSAWRGAVERERLNRPRI